VGRLARAGSPSTRGPLAVPRSDVTAPREHGAEHRHLHLWSWMVSTTAVDGTAGAPPTISRVRRAARPPPGTAPGGRARPRIHVPSCGAQRARQRDERQWTCVRTESRRGVAAAHAPRRRPPCLARELLRQRSRRERAAGPGGARSVMSPTERSRPRPRLPDHRARAGSRSDLTRQAARPRSSSDVIRRYVSTSGAGRGGQLERLDQHLEGPPQERPSPSVLVRSTS